MPNLWESAPVAGSEPDAKQPLWSTAPLVEEQPRFGGLAAALRSGQEPEAPPETGAAIYRGLTQNPVAVTAGRTLDLAGGMMKGAVQDVGGVLGGNVQQQTPSTFRSVFPNLSAAAMEQPTPRDVEMAQDKSWADIPEQAVETFAENLPRLGAMTVGGGGAAAGALAFGLNKEGLQPVQAAIGALFPGATAIGNKLGIRIGTKLGLGTTGLKALETAGGMAAAQVLFEGPNAPLYLDPTVPTEQKFQRFVTDLAANAAFSVPHLIQLGVTARDVRNTIRTSEQMKSAFNEFAAQVAAQKPEAATAAAPQEPNATDTVPVADTVQDTAARDVAERQQGAAGAQDQLRAAAPVEAAAPAAATAGAEAAPVAGPAPIRKSRITPTVKESLTVAAPAAEQTPKSSTQLTLKPQDAAPVLAFASKIPDADVYSKPDASGKEDYGRETEPHITALYGLTNHQPEPVSKAIENHGPVTVTLGKTSVFENPEYDVLKVDVTGEQLHALNGKLVKLPNENSFPDYKPHMTIAYLKKGTGAKYAGDTSFEGKKLTFDTVTFSPPSEIRATQGRPELPLSNESRAVPASEVPVPASSAVPVAATAAPAAGAAAAPPAPAQKRAAAAAERRSALKREQELRGSLPVTAKVSYDIKVEGKLPIEAALLEEYKLPVPEGYIRDGDVYQYQLPAATAPEQAAAPAAAPVKEQSKPQFTMTFEQFFAAPREGELLDALRKLPRSEKTPQQVAAETRMDAASTAVDKAGLSWIYDRSDPLKKGMVESQIRKLSKAKKKIIDEYESAIDEKIGTSKWTREGQKVLYDKAVSAGVIENPEAIASSLLPGGEPEAATSISTGISAAQPWLSEQRRAELWWQEVAVHGGLESDLWTGQDRADIDKMVMAAAPLLSQEAESIAKKAGFLSFLEMQRRYQNASARSYDVSTPEGQRNMTFELLSRKAEDFANDPALQRPSWWRDMIGKLQLWLARRFGFKLTAAGVEALIRVGAKNMEGVELQTAVIPRQDGASDLVFSLPTGPKQAQDWMEQGQLAVPERVSAAVSEPARMLERITAAMPTRVLRLIGLDRDQRLLEFSNAIDPTTVGYDANLAKPGMDTPYAKTELTNGAYQQTVNLTYREAALQKRLAAAFKIVSSREFIARTLRAMDAKTVAEAMASARDTLKGQISQDVAKLKFEADERSKLGGREEQIRADIRRVEALTDYSQAVAQKTADIVDVLGGDAAGRTVLEGAGTGTEIAREYNRLLDYLGYDKIKPGDELALVNLASQVLAANRDLRTTLDTIRELKADPKLKADVEKFGLQLRNALMKDPAKAADLLLTKFGSAQQKADKAAFQYAVLNKAVVKQLDNFNLLRQSVDALAQLHASPEYRAYANKVADAVGGIPIPPLVQALATGKRIAARDISGSPNLIAPDGSVYPLRSGSSKADSAVAWATANDYMAKVQEWLDAPENADSPYRKFWNRQMDLVEGYYANSLVLSPTSVIPLGAGTPLLGKYLRSALQIPDFFFDQATLPFAKATRIVLENLESAFNVARGWFPGNGAKMVTAATRASKSHGFDPARGNIRWQQEVLGEMGWLARTGRPVRAGDTMSNGIVLTAEDVAALHQQGEATTDLIKGQKNIGREKVMPGDLVFDEWGANRWSMRKPLERGGEPGTTLMKSFSARGRDLARDANDLQKRGAPLSAWYQMLNSERFWPAVVDFITKRQGTYIQKSVFEDQYKDLAQEFKGPDAPKSVEDVVKFIEERSTDEARSAGVAQQFIGEIAAREAKFWKEFVEPEFGEPTVTSRKEMESGFTRGFEGDVETPFHYDYGAVTDAQALSMSVNSLGFQFSRLAYALDGLEEEMKVALAPFNRVKGTASEQPFLKDAAKRFKAGEDFRDFSYLESMLRQVQGFKGRLASWAGHETVESRMLRSGELNRFLGNMIKSALTGGGTIVHIVAGTASKQPMLFAPMYRGMAVAYPSALASLALSSFKIPVMTAIGGMKVAMRNAPDAVKAMWNTDGNLKAKFAQATYELLKGVAEENVKASSYLIEQRATGLVPDQTLADTIYRNMINPESRGRGYDPGISGGPVAKWTKRSLYHLYASPEFGLDILNQYFPQLGYNIVYDAAARQAHWTLKLMEGYLFAQFDKMVSSGTLGRFDLDKPSNPANVLKASDVLAGLPGTPRSQTDLNLVRDWFRAIDVPFNELVLHYWEKLEELAPEQRKEAHFLSGDVPLIDNPDGTVSFDKAREDQVAGQREVALHAVNLRDVHHASISNRSWFLRTNAWARQMEPFAGWGMQTMRQMTSLLGRANHDPHYSITLSRALQAVTILGALGVIAGNSETILKPAMRLFRKYILGEADPTKLLIEARSGPEAGKILLADLIQNNHLAQGLVDRLLGLSSSKTGGDFNIFALDKIKEFIDQMSAMVATGKPPFRLAQFAGRQLPFIRPVTNMLESRQGAVAQREAIAVIKRNEPSEMANADSGPPAPPTALSPIKDEIRNAIYRGDVAALPRLKQEFVAKATELGRADPEKLFTSTVEALGLWQSANGSKPSAAQRQEAMATMSAAEQATVTAAEQRYAAAASALGLSGGSTKGETPAQNTASGAPGGGGGALTPVQRLGGAVRGIGARLRGGLRSRTAGIRGPVQARIRLARPGAGAVRSGSYARYASIRPARTAKLGSALRHGVQRG